MLPRSLAGMVDVKSRRCAAEGCNKYPAFNVPGESTARYCGDHRHAQRKAAKCSRLYLMLPAGGPPPEPSCAECTACCSRSCPFDDLMAASYGLRFSMSCC